MNAFRALRARLNRADPEYFMFGWLLLFAGAVFQINDAVESLGWVAGR